MALCVGVTAHDRLEEAASLLEQQRPFPLQRRLQYLVSFQRSVQPERRMAVSDLPSQWSFLDANWAQRCTLSNEIPDLSAEQDQSPGTHGIVNSRADNESAELPASANLVRAAEELGVTFEHTPMDPRSITGEEVEFFFEAP